MKLIPILGKANANLYRHPETGIIYFWMSKAGKGRVQKSTGTDNLSTARRIADEIKYKFLGARNPKQGRKLALELCEEWFKNKQTFLRPRSISRYQTSLDRLSPFMAGLGPEDLNEEWWENEYIPRVRRQAPDTRFFNDRKMLNAFINHLLRNQTLSRKPSFINPDKKSTKGKVYSDDEITRLLREACPDLQLQIVMALSMFMRKGEILLLKLSQIDARKKSITLTPDDTKTKLGRSFGISDWAWPMIKARLGHQSGYLFPSRTSEAKPVGVSGNQTAWEGCKRRAKVTGRFHDLRHTALTKAFKAPGANAALICNYAGLSLEEAERTYLHFTADDTRGVSSLIRPVLSISMGEK